MQPSTQGRPARFAWMEYDAYLFDIDGTLLNCADAVHYFAFCDALSSLAGRPLDLQGVVTHGNTDVGILRDALQLANISEAHWRPRLIGARDQMCTFVEQHTGDFQITVLPGVVEVLNHLRDAGKVLGVATGNLEAIGRAKLNQAALLACFSFGGYSDDFEYRSDVFLGAVEKARALAGKQARICVFGDTPEDIRAARANTLDVIAVATGIFSFEELQSEQPDLCLKSLEELLASHSSNSQAETLTLEQLP